MNEKRVRQLRDGPLSPGPVVYWMSRDQRTKDNWALLFAQRIAIKRKQPLSVVFCLTPQFLGATIRQYGFMIKGLKETEEALAGRNIPFHLLAGRPEVEIPAFVRKRKVAAIVADFDPLRIKRGWKEKVASIIQAPFYEVDAHNIVPCSIASQKQEYAAYTFRPKIRRALGEFLEEFPSLRRHPFAHAEIFPKTDWGKVLNELRVDRTVPQIEWKKPGEREAQKALRKFLGTGLSRYAGKRNDPAADGQSNLSPYLHFGQIAPQRVALEVMRSEADKQNGDAFLEELIVRRELADNFCFYNLRYDSVEGFPAWAQETLDAHRSDRRSFLYSKNDFEQARTHDDLWNAAQIEMTTTGKMHGYMRMYWAKKILEWTASPEEAMEIAISLNDRYELDGRDPNGYAGIAWSIGGVHDRAWGERDVFGKVRYMSYAGCRGKFDVEAYIRHVRDVR